MECKIIQAISTALEIFYYEAYPPMGLHRLYTQTQELFMFTVKIKAI